MNKYSRKAKGKGLEDYLEKGLSELKKLQKCLYTRVKVDKKRSKESCDFIISTHYHTFYIDCKETTKGALPLSNIKDHQIKDLTLAQNLNCVGALLVWFSEYDKEMNNLRLIDGFNNKITIESGHLFDWSIFLCRFF